MDSTSNSDKRDAVARRMEKKLPTIPNYDVIEEVGKGGYGVVFRAKDTTTGAAVAIKSMSMRKLDKQDLASIELEIHLLKKLKHDNIVKYHGSLKHGRNLYIILEFVENGSIQQTISRHGVFSEGLAAVYTFQVLEGLVYLHDQGVIHRDIKGANILTTAGGLVKLADFGVASMAADGTNSVAGTPYWMAPEVIEMSGVTPACDVWSVGCTVVEMLTGKPPYANMTSMTALFRIVQDERPPLPENISPECADFLIQCFQKDPLERATALDLQRHPWIIKNVSAAAQRGLEDEETQEGEAEPPSTVSQDGGAVSTSSPAVAEGRSVRSAWDQSESYSDDDMFPEWRTSQRPPLESPQESKEVLTEAEPSPVPSGYSSSDDEREFVSDLRSSFALGAALQHSQDGRTAEKQATQAEYPPPAKGKRKKRKKKPKKAVPAFVNNTLKQSLRRFRESVGGFDEQTALEDDYIARENASPLASPPSTRSKEPPSAASTPQVATGASRNLPPLPLKQGFTQPESQQQTPASIARKGKRSGTHPGGGIPSPVSIASIGTFTSQASFPRHQQKDSVASPDSMAFAALSADAKAEAEEEARTLSYQLALSCAAYITWTGWREGEAESVDEAEDYVYRKYEEMISRVRASPALRYALGQLSSLVPLISILPSPWTGPLVMSAGATYSVLPLAIEALFKPGGLLHQEPVEPEKEPPPNRELQDVAEEEGEDDDTEKGGSDVETSFKTQSKESSKPNDTYELTDELFWRLSALVPTLSAVIQSGWADDHASSSSEVWKQLMQVCRRWSLSVWIVLRALEETMRFERSSMETLAEAGYLPRILTACSPGFENNVREQAARVLRGALSRSSRSTMAAFVHGHGLHALCQLLEPSISASAIAVSPESKTTPLRRARERRRRHTESSIGSGRPASRSMDENWYDSPQEGSSGSKSGSLSSNPPSHVSSHRASKSYDMLPATSGSTLGGRTMHPHGELSVPLLHTALTILTRFLKLPDTPFSPLEPQARFFRVPRVSLVHAAGLLAPLTQALWRCYLAICHGTTAAMAGLQNGNGNQPGQDSQRMSNRFVSGLSGDSVGYQMPAHAAIRCANMILEIFSKIVRDDSSDRRALSMSDSGRALRVLLRLFRPAPYSLLRSPSYLQLLQRAGGILRCLAGDPTTVDAVFTAGALSYVVPLLSIHPHNIITRSPREGSQAFMFGDASLHRTSGVTVGAVEGRSISSQIAKGMWEDRPRSATELDDRSRSHHGPGFHSPSVIEATLQGYGREDAMGIFTGGTDGKESGQKPSDKGVQAPPLSRGPSIDELREGEEVFLTGMSEHGATGLVEGMKGVHQQLCHCVYHLCRMSVQRQEAAAAAGVCTPLVQLLSGSSWTGADTVAMTVLVELTQTSAMARERLWDAGFAPAILQLLPHARWALQALNALAIWSRHDSRLQRMLLKPENQHKLALTFRRIVRFWLDSGPEGEAVDLPSDLQGKKMYLRARAGQVGVIGKRGELEKGAMSRSGASFDTDDVDLSDLGYATLRSGGGGKGKRRARTREIGNSATLAGRVRLSDLQAQLLSSGGSGSDSSALASPPVASPTPTPGSQASGDTPSASGSEGGVATTPRDFGSPQTTSTTVASTKQADTGLWPTLQAFLPTMFSLCEGAPGVVSGFGRNTIFMLTMRELLQALPVLQAVAARYSLLLLQTVIKSYDSGTGLQVVLRYNLLPLLQKANSTDKRVVVGAMSKQVVGTIHEFSKSIISA